MTHRHVTGQADDSVQARPAQSQHDHVTYRGHRERDPVAVKDALIM